MIRDNDSIANKYHYMSNIFYRANIFYLFNNQILNNFENVTILTVFHYAILRRPTRHHQRPGDKTTRPPLFIHLIRFLSPALPNRPIFRCTTECRESEHDFFNRPRASNCASTEIGVYISAATTDELQHFSCGCWV